MEIFSSSLGTHPLSGSEKSSEKMKIVVGSRKVVAVFSGGVSVVCIEGDSIGAGCVNGRKGVWLDNEVCVGPGNGVENNPVMVVHPSEIINDEMIKGIAPLDFQ